MLHVYLYNSRFILSIIGLLIFNFSSNAQFTLDAEIRPRFEYRHGYKTVIKSNQSNAAFTEQRTRLNIGYKASGYNFKISLQDVHVWGSQPQLINTYGKVNENGSLLSLHEAWAEALFSENWKFKFGRQEIVLDDHRIFGSVGWAAQARSHDAGIIIYKKKKLTFHLGFAYNQDRANLVGTDASNGSYKAFQYFWFHNDFSDELGISFLLLNNGKEQKVITSNIGTPGSVDEISYKDNYSQTFGTHIVYKKSKLKVGSNIYWQTGLVGDRNKTFEDVAGKSFDKGINAFNLGIDISYKMNQKWTGTIGYEYLSGNSRSDNITENELTNHAFTPFYGTNHKFNGHMDYFYVGNHVGSVGLNDAYFKIKYAAEKIWIGTDMHFFSAAENVKNDDRFLGTEMDLSLGFKMSKGVDFKAGYSVMFDTETLATLKGSVDIDGRGDNSQSNTWGWVMITIKPNFLKEKE